jgi:alpha-beta hydrolase superfamily lysophospholipase
LIFSGYPYSLLRATVLVFLLLLAQACDRPPPKIWHTVDLTEEFTADKADEIRTLKDYLALEERLFAQLDEEVYAQTGTGPAYALFRYSRGSIADPQTQEPNWNRSFELTQVSPVGGILLLHGMSDSPYSLRALAQSLHARGYWVVGLRLPGHGTAPSGLVHISAEDMIAATRLGMTHLHDRLGNKPVHMLGYSTGAALALDFALDAMAGDAKPVPASLVLISPAIRVSNAAALASFQDGLSVLPGMDRMAWLDLLPEYDPYKYNSFATNAADVVHRLTTGVDGRIAKRVRANKGFILPPTLVFKSAVDATVTTEAVVDNLLTLLPPYRHELVLYDINRSAVSSVLLKDNSGPLTTRLMTDKSLPFTVTFISNESPETSNVVARHKQPFSVEPEKPQALGANWPVDVLSLSHIALSFPPDDPLYGRYPPEDNNFIYLGQIALRSERGLHRLPTDLLLRMRYNPFYQSLENKLFNWLESTNG